MSWKEKFEPLIDGAKHTAERIRPPEGPLAISLAGGGSRASFQIGALRYLYDHEHIAPDMYTGTSAGAILASALAQHSDPEDQRRALAQVEEIWSAMTSNEDMFTELPWFAKLRTHLPTWMKVVSMRSEGPRKTLTQTIQTTFSEMFSRRAEEGEGEDQIEHDDDPDTKAINPIETLSTLWEGARATTDLQQIFRGFRSQTSAFLPGPVVQRLLDPSVFDPARLAASAVELRISMVGLESGKLRFVTGRGELRNRLDQEIDYAPVDYVDAVTASCAIPGVFPPVQIGEEHYVDGGIRANLPVDMAYNMGAKRVIAIVSGARGPAPSESFLGGDLLGVIMRSAVGIMPDELERLQIRIAKAQGATVIEPVIDVHDALTVDPGLIAIATDYGWMRAYDVMHEVNAKRQQLSHDITDLRRHLWAIEDHLFGPEPAETANTATSSTDPQADLQRLGEMKLQLRDLIRAAKPKTLPEGAEDWWQGWEKHPYPITEHPSWMPAAG